MAAEIVARVKCSSPAIRHRRSFAEHSALGRTGIREPTSIRQECLEHFISFGDDHLRQIVSEYATYHNEERPHQGGANARLRRLEEEEPPEERAEGAIASGWAAC